MDNRKTTIIKQLPPTFRQLFENVSFDGLEEIRFRREIPIMLYRRGELSYLLKNGRVSQNAPPGEGVKKQELAALAECFFNSSVYAYLHDIRDGFITLRGGHRVGLAGRGIFKDGEITNITEISGINLRVAGAYTGCAEKLDKLLRKSGLQNTLIIAPPQCGKTTYLRDLTRLASAIHKVTVVDERSEIAAVFDGVPQFDVGSQTDVLDRFPKLKGMILAIRSLSPELLVVDEIGTESEAEALKSVQNAGCKLLASVHGYDVASVKNSKPHLLSCFEQAVVLGRRNGTPSVLSVEQLR